jgi:ATP-dependent HslUV protease ATP-binding subunit HslU
MTTLLEEVLYELPDGARGRIVVDPEMVRERLKSIAEDEDLRKWIL